MQDFEHFYREHAPFVWAAAWRLRVPAHAVDDAVQEVFLVAHRRMGELDDVVSPRAWLYGVTRRVVFRQRRTSARLARKRFAFASTQESRSEPHHRHEAARDASRLLKGLEQDQREVFVMSELLGMHAPEIAVAVGVPVNTVYSRLRLARRRLENNAAREGPLQDRLDAARAEQHVEPDRMQRAWAALVPMLEIPRRAAVPLLMSWFGAGVLVASSVMVASAAAVNVAVQIQRPKTDVSVTARRLETAAIRSSSNEHRNPDVSANFHGDVDPLANLGRDLDAPVDVHRDLDLPANRPAHPTTVPNDRNPPAPAAPSRTAAVPRLAASPATASVVAEEVRLLSAAEAAYLGGTYEAALSILANHAARYPEGRFGDVRRATEVRVLCALGRIEEAELKARRFRAEYPESNIARSMTITCSTSDGI